MSTVYRDMPDNNSPFHDISSCKVIKSRKKSIKNRKSNKFNAQYDTESTRIDNYTT